MSIISMDKQYTSNGRPVRILCVGAKYEGSPVLALIDEGTHERIRLFKANGDDLYGADENNLIEVKPKRTGWVNVYAYNEIVHGSIFNDRPAADQSAASGRIACIEVSFVEGEGL